MAAEAKKQKNIGSNISMLGLLCIIVLLAFTIYTSERDLRSKEQFYIEKEQSLEREISEEQARTAELQEQKKYVTTNQYIKEVARDRLGLLEPDEIILKAKEE